ncbi:hypothetical protein SADUNF_Sadunf07G0078800 [Salix dunnii]|uniref:Uncharacterized protein n=1 Tax=Salix dunnii TaxID=1413687 RepID=A0A835N2D1_9ROSI|nr:hypothetical protein SADUNF_Sadunf07G0078800 [Salix dunnii]
MKISSLLTKVSSYGTMLVMTTRTTSFKDQMVNLITLIEGILASLKANNHRMMFDGIYTMNLLKDIIRAHIDHIYKTNLLRMPLNFQSLKFKQFNGKKILKQYMAHFIDILNNFRINGYLITHLFVP